jgi:hypothetical protein
MAYETIKEPGKFEGELSIPKMWDVALEGFGAEVYVGETLYSFVSLYAVDEQPADGLYGACLWERSDGFVMAKWYSTEAEYNAAMAELEDESEEETDEDAD